MRDFYFMGRYHGGFFRHIDVYYHPARELCWAIRTGTNVKCFASVDACLGYAKSVKLIRGDLVTTAQELTEKARRIDDEFFKVETPERVFYRGIRR